MIIKILIAYLMVVGGWSTTIDRGHEFAMAAINDAVEDAYVQATDFIY